MGNPQETIPAQHLERQNRLAGVKYSYKVTRREEKRTGRRGEEGALWPFGKLPGSWLFDTYERIKAETMTIVTIGLEGENSHGKTRPNPRETGSYAQEGAQVHRKT